MMTASRTPEELAEVEALAALAQREHAAGRLAEAADAYSRIVALRPDFAEAHNNLGIIRWHQGMVDQALACFEQAVTLRPDHAEVHNNLGTVLLNQGKFDEAAARYEQAIAIWPQYVQAHYNLANTLFKQDRLDEAAASYERVLALRPDFAEAHCNLGNILWRQRKLDEAVARHEQALALRPDFAEAHHNLGNIRWVQGKSEQAAARYEQALAFQPNHPEAHYQLGNTLWLHRKFDEAAAHYQQALDLRPDYADAHWGLAACSLVQGDYERGWPAYEGRLHAAGLEPSGLARWSGEPLAGRTLLLLAEQGIGDTLHFIRYARLLKEQGARLVLASPAVLGRLLTAHPDVDELFLLGSAAQLPPCDFYLPLPSAPGAFHTTALTIPGEVPYLWADPELAEKWRAELAGIDGFKIGIAWQGVRDFGFDPWRSIPLAQFAPLARLPGVRLIGLQKGFGSEQIATVDFPLLDLSDRLDDVAGPFMDTAAVIEGLDLVVTADTGIAHLTGALGKPVWLALQFSPDWRWQQGREDSPWYPTMRLFRQTTFDGWPDVFERIAQAVQETLTFREAPAQPAPDQPTAFELTVPEPTAAEPTPPEPIPPELTAAERALPGPAPPQHAPPQPEPARPARARLASASTDLDFLD